MPAERPRARPDVLFRRLADDEWALFDPKAGRLHALNLSAALIWEHCDGSCTTPEIVAALGRAFDPAPPTLAEDVRATLARFAHEGLLEWT